MGGKEISVIKKIGLKSSFGFVVAGRKMGSLRFLLCSLRLASQDQLATELCLQF